MCKYGKNLVERWLEVNDVIEVVMQGTVYVCTCDLNTFAVGLATLFTGILLCLILYKTVSAVTQTGCII